MASVKSDLRRLQCLFEHCCLQTMVNMAARQMKLDFDKNEAGAYTNLETEDLFSLWLAGRNQGVVDQAFMSGGVQL